MTMEIESMKVVELSKEPQQFYPKKKEILPEPNTLDNMIKGLRILFDQDDVNVDQVKKYMGEYQSNPEEWTEFAKFDPHRYAYKQIQIPL